MRKINIHILYEYGLDMRPHGSAYLRLLRPLTHPCIRENFVVTASRELANLQAKDIVLTDRLWHKTITPRKVLELSNKVHQKGAKLMHWFDDNFLETDTDASKNVSGMQRESFQMFLEQSDAFVVTTPALEAAFQNYGKPVYLIPNALDDRLVIQKPFHPKYPGEKIIIGYMGTGTHDDDLRMILPAFQAIYEKYQDRVVFQIVGALNEARLRRWDELNRLPVSLLEPLPAENEYPPFMLWFTGHVTWDIAVAPLVDSKFNQFKSDIKFLDYTAAGIPAVYSRGEAYSATVEDKKTGFLVENNLQAWTTALDELAQDENVRKSMRENARSYLYSRRVISRCGHIWVNTLHNFYEKYTDV